MESSWKPDSEQLVVMEACQTWDILECVSGLEADALK